MRHRSPLTEIDSSTLSQIAGIPIPRLFVLRQNGMPHWFRNRNTKPFKIALYNLYDVVKWLQLLVDKASAAHSRTVDKLDTKLLQRYLSSIRDFISTFKKTHTMPTINSTPSAPGAKAKTPTPFKSYPADRRMLTGDSVYTRLFFGRANGLTPDQLNRTATVTKDEDNFGCVLVRFSEADDTVHSIPVCNLLLLRAVEDIPVLSILADTFAFYITTKGVSEAVAAFWFGGKTGRLKDDARALAELNLEILKKENN